MPATRNPQLPRSYNRGTRSIPLRRNTIVLITVIFLLAVFAWAGWANWEYRKQAAEKLLAHAGQGDLVPAPGGDAMNFVSPLDGKPAPPFALENLSGSKVSLTSYKGKAVMINFWATWCGPCKVETPWIVELRRQIRGAGL